MPTSPNSRCGRDFGCDITTRGSNRACTDVGMRMCADKTEEAEARPSMPMHGPLLENCDVGPGMPCARKQRSLCYIAGRVQVCEGDGAVSAADGEAAQSSTGMRRHDDPYLGLAERKAAHRRFRVRALSLHVSLFALEAPSATSASGEVHADLAVGNHRQLRTLKISVCHSFRYKRRTARLCTSGALSPNAAHVFAGVEHAQLRLRRPANEGKQQRASLQKEPRCTTHSDAC